MEGPRHLKPHLGYQRLPHMLYTDRAQTMKNCVHTRITFPIYCLMLLARVVLSPILKPI